MEGTQNRLKELREGKEMSKVEVAALTGRGSSLTVDRWENGTTPIPDDAKLILSRHFKVSVEHLLGWDQEKAAA